MLVVVALRVWARVFLGFLCAQCLSRQLEVTKIILLLVCLPVQLRRCRLVVLHLRSFRYTVYDSKFRSLWVCVAFSSIFLEAKLKVEVGRDSFISFLCAAAARRQLR